MLSAFNRDGLACDDDCTHHGICVTTALEWGEEDLEIWQGILNTRVHLPAPVVVQNEVAVENAIAIVAENLPNPIEPMQVDDDVDEGEKCAICTLENRVTDLCCHRCFTTEQDEKNLNSILNALNDTFKAEIAKHPVSDDMLEKLQQFGVNLDIFAHKK